MTEADRDEKARRTGRIVEKLSKLQQAFGRPVVREAVISGLVVLILIIGVVGNLPDSEIKRTSMPVLRPIASGAGLERVWNMYAPEPVRRLETVEVHVTMANRVVRVWTSQRGDRVVGHFAWYRWHKLEENMVRRPDIRAGIAHWVVRELTRPSEHAIHVRMILRTELLPPPGADSPRTTAVETLYDESLSR